MVSGPIVDENFSEILNLSDGGNNSDADATICGGIAFSYDDLTDIEEESERSDWSTDDDDDEGGDDDAFSDQSDCPSAHSDNSDWMLHDVEPSCNADDDVDFETADDDDVGDLGTSSLASVGQLNLRTDDDEDVTSESGEEDRQSTWSLSTSTSLFRSISAYDNNGDKKVSSPGLRGAIVGFVARGGD